MILLVSSAIAFVAGTMTDMIANRLVVGAFPQMAVIILLIPISGTFMLLKTMV